jgi:hypothetical protein
MAKEREVLAGAALRGGERMKEGASTVANGGIGRQPLAGGERGTLVVLTSSAKTDWDAKLAPQPYPYFFVWKKSTRL